MYDLMLGMNTYQTFPTNSVGPSSPASSVAAPPCDRNQLISEVCQMMAEFSGGGSTSQRGSSGNDLQAAFGGFGKDRIAQHLSLIHI